MKNALLEYLEDTLGMDTDFVKVASYLHDLSAEDTALLHQALQDGTFDREIEEPKTKLAEARGRLFARHEFRKQAAAAGYTPDAIVGEAIDTLTSGSNLNASLRRVGELEKTAFDPEAETNRRTKRDMRAMSAYSATSGGALGGAIGGSLSPLRFSGKNALIGAGVGAAAGYGLRKLKNLTGTKQRLQERHRRNVYREGALKRISTAPPMRKQASWADKALYQAELEKQAGIATKALGWLGNLAKGSKTVATAAKVAPKPNPTSYLGNVWKGFKGSGRQSFSNPIKSARDAASRHAPGVAGGPSAFGKIRTALKGNTAQSGQHLGRHLGKYKGIATYGVGGALAAKGALGD